MRVGLRARGVSLPPPAGKVPEGWMGAHFAHGTSRPSPPPQAEEGDKHAARVRTGNDGFAQIRVGLRAGERRQKLFATDLHGSTRIKRPIRVHPPLSVS
jgi:hypothetical protein